MRTFVAIQLNDECRSAAASVLEKLRAAVQGVAWVRPESLHITVKFLGEIEERSLDDAISALNEAASGAKPFRMLCAKVSGFPPRGPLRVIHVGIEEPTGALSELARRVDEAMATVLGVRPETRPFHAHITIGRVKRPRECMPLPEIVRMAGEPARAAMRVESVALMRSELTPRGAVYDALARAALGP